LQATPDITLNNLGWTDEARDSAGETRVTLDAELTPFDGNYRAAMQRIEDFMRTLLTKPGVHDVSLSSSPVNADSSSTLSGNTLGANAATAPAAHFSLTLFYREVRP
jgi:hypothetical protein